MLLQYVMRFVGDDDDEDGGRDGIAPKLVGSAGFEPVICHQESSRQPYGWGIIPRRCINPPEASNLLGVESPTPFYYMQAKKIGRKQKA